MMARRIQIIAMTFAVAMAGAPATTIAAGSCSASSAPAVTGRSGWEAYKRWCSACGGRVAGDLNTAQAQGGCKLPSQSGGLSGGYSPQEQAALSLANAAGQMIGEALREALFGSPEQEARRRDEAAQAEALRLQREAEEDARSKRLLGEMQGVENTNLSLMLDSKAPGDLALMTSDDIPRDAPRTKTNPALQDLNRAAWISQQASKAERLEEAVELSNAAFQAAVGASVDVVVPQNVIVVPAEQPRQKEFEDLRGRYFKARDAALTDGDSLVDLEYQRQVTAQVRADAETKLARMETAGASAEDLARARKLRDDSRILEQQIAGRIEQARRDADRRQAGANESEQTLRSFLGPMPGAVKAQDKDKRFEEPSFVKGYMDGSQCFSQNAGVFCYGQTGAASDRCLNNYRAGYSKGEKLKEQMIRNATNIGRKDRDGGVRASGPAQLGAQGSCRITWIEAYNDGYFRAKANLIGR